MTNKIAVLSCCGSAEEAEKIARTLLESRLAACVNVLMQNRSFYWWDDKIEEATEHMLVIKTSADLFDKVSAAIRASHSYRVPEVIALPLSAGSPDYLAWMDRELSA